jgi:hypothetical protein
MTNPDRILVILDSSREIQKGRIRKYPKAARGTRTTPSGRYKLFVKTAQRWPVLAHRVFARAFSDLAESKGIPLRGKS